MAFVNEVEEWSHPLAQTVSVSCSWACPGAAAASDWGTQDSHLMPAWTCRSCSLVLLRWLSVCRYWMRAACFSAILVLESPSLAEGAQVSGTLRPGTWIQASWTGSCSDHLQNPPITSCCGASLEPRHERLTSILGAGVCWVNGQVDFYMRWEFASKAREQGEHDAHRYSDPWKNPGLSVK